MHKALHPRDDIDDSMYQEKKKEEDSVDTSIRRLNNYLKRVKEH